MRMTMRSDERELAELPLFAGCSPKDLRNLTNLGTRLRVNANEGLVKEGTPGAEVMIVLSGTAKCSKNKVEIAEFGPGDFFGEVAVLDGGPRTATVVAETDMEVLVLDPREFNLLLERSSEIGRQMVKALAVRLRSADTVAFA